MKKSEFRYIIQFGLAKDAGGTTAPQGLRVLRDAFESGKGMERIRNL